MDKVFEKTNNISRINTTINKNTSLQILWPAVSQDIFLQYSKINIKTIVHYMQDINDCPILNEAIVAQYDCENFKYFNRDNLTAKFTMYSNHFRSLLGDQYLNGSIIDSFMLTKKAMCASWETINIFPTSLTTHILGDDLDKLKPLNFVGYRFHLKILDTLFLPYCYK